MSVNQGKYFDLNVESCFLVAYRVNFQSTHLPADLAPSPEMMFYWVCTQYSHKLIVYFCALCTLNKESLIISIIFGFFLTLAYHVHTCINAQGIKSNVCLNLYDLPILIETRIITSRWKTCKVLIVRQFNIFLLYTKLHSAERIFTLCEIFMRNILLLYSEQKMFLLSSKIFIKTYKWYCVKVVYPKWRTKCSI